MNTAIRLGLLGGVAAFTNNKIEFFPQQINLNDASCDSGFLLSNGECQTKTYDSSGIVPAAFSIRANVSQLSMSLEEARHTAQRTKDFPWSHWPECFTYENADEPHCVFSKPDFAGGRGIFILTTKSNAYAMLEKPAFKKPEVLAHINQYDNPPFVEHEFPGKGRGLIANKTLHRGDKIFSSTPIIVTDNDAYDLDNAERFALLYRGVETLPPHTQTSFWKLMGHFNGDAVEDRITTNNFEASIDGVSQQALFPEIAMLNHDCRPNAAYAFDEELMTHYVHAIRDIYPGEEITITYTDNERDHHTRVTRLEKNWGFKCACSACTAHPSIIAESDSRLDQIDELVKLLNDWTATSTATPEIAELLVELFKQERLDASLATAYKHAAEAYSSFGKKWEAIKYARLSVDMSMLDKGFSDPDVTQMKKMSENPEMTWSWKKRVTVPGKSCTCGHGH